MIVLILLAYIIGVVINVITLRKAHLNNPAEVYAFSSVILWSWVLVIIGLMAKVYWIVKLMGKRK